MSNSWDERNTPEVMLSLELDSSLIWIFDPSIYEAIHRSLVTGLTEIMRTLGIPGTAVIEITSVGANALRKGQFLRVYVNNQLCRYSDELLRYVHSYVNNSHLDPRATPSNIMEWFVRGGLDFPDKHELEKANPLLEKGVEFFSLTCLEIIKNQPSVLLGLDQIADYIATLPNQ